MFENLLHPTLLARVLAGLAAPLALTPLSAHASLQNCVEGVSGELPIGGPGDPGYMWKASINDWLAQLDPYLAGLGLDTGWLVVFDARTGRVPVEDRTSSEPATTPAGRQVTLVRA